MPSVTTYSDVENLAVPELRNLLLACIGDLREDPDANTDTFACRLWVEPLAFAWMDSPTAWHIVGVCHWYIGDVLDIYEIDGITPENVCGVAGALMRYVISCMAAEIMDFDEYYVDIHTAYELLGHLAERYPALV